MMAMDVPTAGTEFTANFTLEPVVITALIVQMDPLQSVRSVFMEVGGIRKLLLIVAPRTHPDVNAWMDIVQ